MVFIAHKDNQSAQTSSSATFHPTISPDTASSNTVSADPNQTVTPTDTPLISAPNYINLPQTVPVQKKQPISWSVWLIPLSVFIVVGLLFYTILFILQRQKERHDLIIQTKREFHL